ncbi:MAG TPA: hypothetical protein VH105_17170, partial [Burkholderiales bacterium]|nr:hypothetical protein [Burkholderiales bacterium]
MSQSKKSTQPVSAARRKFIISSAAGGGMMLGFSLPFNAQALENTATQVSKTGASGPGAELNAWVVIQPDDTVLVRIARSEMGQ